MSKVTSSLSFVLSAFALELCISPETFRSQAKTSKVPLNLINDTCIQAQILVQNLADKTSLSNTEQKSLSETLDSFRKFHLLYCESKSAVRAPLRNFSESATATQTNVIRSSNSGPILRMIDLIDQYGLVGSFTTQEELDKNQFLDKIPMVCQAFAIHGKETMLYQINRLEITPEISNAFVEAALWLNLAYYKAVDTGTLVLAETIHQKVSTMIDFMAKYARSKSKFYSFVLNFKYRYITPYQEVPHSDEAKKYKELSAFILNNFAQAEVNMTTQQTQATEEQKAPATSGKKVLELSSLLREPAEQKPVVQQETLALDTEQAPATEPAKEVPATKKQSKVKLSPKFKKETAPESKPVVLRGVGPQLMALAASFNDTSLKAPQLMRVDLDEEFQADIISVLGQTSLYGFVLDIPETGFFEEQRYTLAESVDGKVHMFGDHYQPKEGNGITLKNFVQPVETAADVITAFYNYLVEIQTRNSEEPIVVEILVKTKVGNERATQETCDEYTENFIVELANLGLITYEEEVVRTTRAVFKAPAIVPAN